MVKERILGECTFDDNGYKRRAACLVFKDEREEQVSELACVTDIIVLKI